MISLTGGRQAALVFGVPVALVIIVANGFSLVQHLGPGSFPVSYTLPVTPSGVHVSTGGGNVTVRGGAATLAGAALVSGTVRYDLSRPSVRESAGSIGLACPWWDLGNCSLSGTVELPVNTPLDVSTDGGDLSATAITGQATLSTDGGSLTVSGATQDLRLSSTGGDIRADHLSGATVSMSSDGGDIGVSAVMCPYVTATSTGGDVTLTFTAVPRDLQVSTDGGTVTIRVPRAGYIVSTNPDGGNVNAIQSTPGAVNVINVSSLGGDITILSESS